MKNRLEKFWWAALRLAHPGFSTPARTFSDLDRINGIYRIENSPAERPNVLCRKVLVGCDAARLAQGFRIYAFESVR